MSTYTSCKKYIRGSGSGIGGERSDNKYVHTQDCGTPGVAIVLNQSAPRSQYCSRIPIRLDRKECDVKAVEYVIIIIV